MVIVELEDGTTYNVNTDSEFDAKYVVEYKLRDRLDRRRIKQTNIIVGAICDINSKYFNSDNAFDGNDLKCVNGWNYKW